MSRDTPPSPDELKEFRNFVTPILRNVAAQFKPRTITTESFLASKKWPPAKK